MLVYILFNKIWTDDSIIKYPTPHIDLLITLTSLVDHIIWIFKSPVATILGRNMSFSAKCSFVSKENAPVKTSMLQVIFTDYRPLKKNLVGTLHLQVQVHALFLV